MYIAGLLISAPVSGLLIVINIRSRPAWLLPSDEYFRNFGHAFSSRSRSDLISSVSCQRLKSRRTLNCGSEPLRCGARAGVWAPVAATVKTTIAEVTSDFRDMQDFIDLVISGSPCAQRRRLSARQPSPPRPGRVCRARSTDNSGAGRIRRAQE